MKTLVVVESPTKARTIGKFLGDNYEIIASMGHLIDLPKSTLGIDIEKDFAPQYEQVVAKANTITELKSAAKGTKDIILATDPDREGEAIASHVRDLLSSRGVNFKRIVFHEITKEAIDGAFKNPRDIDKNLVNAQTARRVLDRLVGYKLSPLLWKKVRRGLSAGRVQSVALRLVVEREREIEKFKKEKYWTVTAKLKNQSAKSGTEFELIEINNEKIEEKQSFSLYDGDYTVTKTTIDVLEKARIIVSDLSSSTFTVSDVLKKESKRSPAPAFTTSTLQQEASRRFGFSGKRTMSLAQKLYEEGFITYHRTDSVSMSSSAVSAFRGYIEKEFGKKYIPDSPRLYKVKQKLAQEAHEAIRPTKIQTLENEVAESLGRDFGKLYDLIWKRGAASQASDAIIESTTVLVTSNKDHKLKANGSTLIFEGFLKINPQALSDNLLPEFKTGEKLTKENVEEKEHETMPPPRYNDASLIATLEEKGIGRPSTYATIIETIETRRYVERAEGRFAPTNIGLAVNDFLVTNFGAIDDIPFTAEMEDGFDKIASGEKEWVPVIRNFYKPFEETLEKVEDAKRVKIEVEETDEICPQCGSKLVIRIGRFGKFFACSSFPTCRFTKPFVLETDFLCPKDGAKIVIKKTKKGRKFYGCSNYPACDFAAWKLEDIKKPLVT